MDHVRHCAEAAEGIEAVDGERQIRQTERHAVAPLHAQRGKNGSGAVDAAQKGAVAHLRALKLIGDGVGVRPRGLREALIDGFSGIIEMLWHIAVKAQPRGFCGQRHGRPPEI